MRRRDWAYEALASETATDMDVGRGELNAALRDIRKMEPEVQDICDSEMLADLICARAKMYRVVFPSVALTPTALSKHWLRVLDEYHKIKSAGTNQHADPPSRFPPSNREKNREALAQLKETLWPSST